MAVGLRRLTWISRAITHTMRICNHHGLEPWMEKFTEKLLHTIMLKDACINEYWFPLLYKRPYWRTAWRHMKTLYIVFHFGRICSFCITKIVTAAAATEIVAWPRYRFQPSTGSWCWLSGRKAPFLALGSESLVTFSFRSFPSLVLMVASRKTLSRTSKHETCRTRDRSFMRYVHALSQYDKWFLQNFIWTGRQYIDAYCSLNHLK